MLEWRIKYTQQMLVKFHIYTLCLHYRVESSIVDGNTMLAENLVVIGAHKFMVLSQYLNCKVLARRGSIRALIHHMLW